MTSDPVIADIIMWLNGVKMLRGGKNLTFSLQRHPMIKNYLEAYLRDQALDIENTIATLQSK